MLSKKQKTLLSITAIILIVFIASFFLYVKTYTRYAVFAGYNPIGKLEPYVITYLQGLNEVTDGIVYITDTYLDKSEQKKLEGINIIYQLHSPHGEYDWGSYKLGYNWLKQKGLLKKADEIIFANDSTYAPITSFKPMFLSMLLRPHLDFWGDLKNINHTPHLQSYFLVFRSPVFTSQVFDKFINSITQLPSREDYIKKYELTLTQTLSSHGFTWDCYLPYNELSTTPLNDKNSHPIKLIKDYNHQFIKRRTFIGGMVIIEKLDYILNYLKTHHPKTYEDIKSSSHPLIKKSHIPNYKEN